MSLLRGIARTAIISGTATAVSNNVSRRQAGRWAAQEAQYAAQQAQAPAPAAPADGGMDAKISQLKKLGELKEAGILTDAEFEAQKQKILAG
jgi:hypothetical protein